MQHVISIPGFYEPFASMTHLAGAAIFAAFSIWLLRRGRGDLARMASLATFCFGAVFLLSISGLYHLLAPDGAVRPMVRRLDHAAIFVLIACSFTPIHTILFRGWRREGALALIWAVAIVGITLKMVYFYEMPRWLGLSLYLGMGWLGLFTGIMLWRRYGFDFAQPLLWGGLAYTFGCLIEGMHWPVVLDGVIMWHELFHLAVLLGLGCHFAFTYKIADGHVSVLHADGTEWLGYEEAV